jgi:hypothetical protein
VSAEKLTPKQRRKVAQIKGALNRSTNALQDHFYSLDTFERSALKYASGKVSSEWVATLVKLHAELLRARDRLAALHTGLRAERAMRDALGELAAAVDAWRRGMAATTPEAVDAATSAARRHFANAEKVGKIALKDLEAGR